MSWSWSSSSSEKRCLHFSGCHWAAEEPSASRCQLERAPAANAAAQARGDPDDDDDGDGRKGWEQSDSVSVEHRLIKFLTPVWDERAWLARPGHIYAHTRLLLCRLTHSWKTRCIEAKCRWREWTWNVLASDEKRVTSETVLAKKVEV